MNYAAGAVILAKLRILRIVFVLRLFLSIQVVEIAIKLIKAMIAGQQFILIAQVILTKLSGGVA